MKVAGQYANIISGVSQQVPQDRRQGQHAEQINMISDPVRGLVRRQGSERMYEVGFPITHTPEEWAERVRNTQGHKVTSFTVGDREIDVIYRKAAPEDTYTKSAEDGIWFYDKTRNKLLSPLALLTDQVAIRAAFAGGMEAAVNLGAYCLFAPARTIATYTTTKNWYNDGSVLDRSAIAFWIRGAAYNRTFTVKFHNAAGAVVEASYTSPSAGYPGILDTSDILSTDTAYQKKVNDRVNAYNSAVTEWITTAAEGASAKGIMDGLYAAIDTAFVTAGYAAPNRYRNGSTLVCLPRAASPATFNFIEASATDSGDGSLIRVIGNTIDGITAVGPIHFAGKVVRIRPKDGDDTSVTYLKAVAKTTNTYTGPTEVTWEECAGVTTTPTSVLIYGTVYNDSIILATNGVRLKAALTAAGATPPEDVPDYLPSACGDQVTDEVPRFLKEQISYLGVFQDRLVIGTGSTLFFSRTGDYFNWFRKSTTTVEDDDPFELVAFGSETDTIHSSTTYDRNLVMFGEKLQYILNGRVAITPANSTLVVQSAHEDAVDAAPVSTGNYVQFAKYRDSRCSLHQVQAGVVSDTPESTMISQQLDTYLDGKPVQILPFTAPNHTVLRTLESNYGFYVYTYLDDAGQQRQFDSWSRWEWASKMGHIIGIGTSHGELIVYTLKQGPSNSGDDAMWFNATRFSFDTTLTDKPCLDGLVKQSELLTSTSYNTSMVTDGASIAFGAGSDYAFIGAPLDRISDLDDYEPEDKAELYIGYDYPAYVVPTNPYPRDRQSKAVLTGRMTLTRLLVSMAQTGGLLATITSTSGTSTALDSKARILGAENNILGSQPISTYTQSFLVSKEVRECSYRLQAQTWLPLTITAIEYVAQYFNNVKRL